MATRIVINNGGSFDKLLTQNLSGADTFLVATAYLNTSGLNHVMTSVERILDAEGEVNVVHGFYPHITETETIRNLARLADGSDRMSYGVYTGAKRSLEGSFHPKIYLTHSQAHDWRVVVGSSNLTRGGLKSNLEVNCVLAGSSADPAIRQCKEIFNKIQNDPNIHRPTIEWIEAYDHIRNLERDNRDQFNRDTEEAYKRLFNITQVPQWQAETRYECVVKALQFLENIDGGGTFHHYTDISLTAKQIAAGRFKEKYWIDGVRQALNTNTVYRDMTKSGKSKKLFERRDGDKGTSGDYRLSDIGRMYRGRR